MATRRVIRSWENWFKEHRKELMQRYIRTPTKVLWLAWLRAEYESYRNGNNEKG